MRSSMSVRIRNHASTPAAVSNPAPPVGRLVARKLVVNAGPKLAPLLLKLAQQ